MELPEIVVHATFLLLLASISLWVLVYWRLYRRDPENERYYRYHQILIGLVALLSILLAAIILLSSNPGEPNLYLQGY
ncbi:MAG: hypothetical protein PVI79_11585 [Gammaproteobacteria bacterium]|jgi:hypothetical protein